MTTTASPASTVEASRSITSADDSKQQQSPTNSIAIDSQASQQQQQWAAPTAPDFVAIEIHSQEATTPAATQQREEHKKDCLERIDAAAVAATEEAAAAAAAQNEAEEDEGKVCRVCHLTLGLLPEPPLSGQSNESMEAIELGCGCKQDLAVAHRRCAETWFKIKGNRTCEICGQPAHNVSAIAGGVGSEDYSCGRRSDELSGEGVNAIRGTTTNSEPTSFWHHRPICNFVLAFVVIILLLPWLFRIRLF